LRLSIWIVVAITVLFGKEALGQFAFEKVADLGVNQFSHPVLSEGKVVWSETSGDDVIRYWDGTTTTTVVDTSTLIPGTNETFSTISSPQYSEGVITFLGRGENSQLRGIYQFDGTVISKIVDSDSFVPGTGNSFQTFREIAVDGTDLAFSAVDDSGTRGIFRYSNDVLTQIADTNTLRLRPGSTEAFVDFGAVAIENGVVAFTDASSTLSNIQRGVHSHSNGVLRTLFTDETTVSENGQQFGGIFPELAIDGETLLVRRTPGGGIYTSSIFEESLEMVAETSTEVPGENGTVFLSLSSASIDSKNVVFVGRLPEGLYARINGELVNIIQRGDIIEGKAVQNFLLSKTAIDGDQVAVNIRFGSSPSNITSNSIYLITIPSVVPEPSSVFV
jgi:hypothetical protein